MRRTNTHIQNQAQTVIESLFSDFLAAWQMNPVSADFAEPCPADEIAREILARPAVSATDLAIKLHLLDMPLGAIEREVCQLVGRKIADGPIQGGRRG